MALKAYSFSENENFNAGVHDKEILEHERKLAAEFVKSHPCQTEPGDCPLCGSGDIEGFAVIGGAQYKRCNNCWSLFTPVSEEIIQKYREYAPLVNFRQSMEYQEIGIKKRMSVWQEQLFWMQFRCARYLAQLKTLSIMELGSRYIGFSNIIKSSCASLISFKNISEAHGKYDAVLFFGTIMQEPNPVSTLIKVRKHIKKDGLLFLDTRVSTGYDILTLKGKINNLYPYDCIFIPSIEAISMILNNSGFDVLEITTPGVLDILYVTENDSKLEKGNLFSRYLVEKTDISVKSDFQRFLQKNLLSSHAQLVARIKS